MKIKRTLWFIFPCSILAAGLILTGCNLLAAPPAIEEGSDASEDGLANIVSTTAVVIPKQEATLRFKNNANNVRILVQKGEQVEAGDVLVESDTFQQRLAVDEAKAQLTNAQALYDGLLREEFREVRQPEKDAAFEQIEAAEAALDLAEKNLDAASIRAPFDGSIIEIYIDPFVNVFAGEPILLIADVEQFTIETDDLDEKEAARVREGDKAQIFFDAIPDVRAEGVVTQIAEKATSGAGNDFTVTISGLETVENLRWGMSAYVEIAIGSGDGESANTAAEEGEAAEATRTESDNVPERRICETMDFLSETVEDGTVFAAGETFTKSWTFRNIGTCTWDTTYRMVFMSGDQMDAPAEIPFPGYTAPDDLMTIELNLTAPEAEGDYRGDWQIQNDLGAKLYDVWVEIEVGETQ